MSDTPHDRGATEQVRRMPLKAHVTLGQAPTRKASHARANRHLAAASVGCGERRTGIES